jgi:hypothetical protein
MNQAPRLYRNEEIHCGLKGLLEVTRISRRTPKLITVISAWGERTRLAPRSTGRIQSLYFNTDHFDW